MYNAAEKSLLSVAFIPCALLQALIYWFAKRSINAASETTERRMEMWFACTSGILLGMFMFHVLPQSALVGPGNGWSYNYLAAFLMGGFYVFMWIDKLSRVQHYSPAYAGLPAEEATESVPTDDLLDTKQMQRTSYLEMTDISKAEYAEKLARAQNLDNIINRRSCSAVLLYVILVFICIVDGLYLVYRQELALGGTTGMVVCFYVDKMMESLVVATILVYGQFHTLEPPWSRWYGVLCTVWCMVIILSTVPVLNETPVAEIATVVEHPALGAFYSAAAGCIFYTAIYFVFVNRQHTDRCEMIWRLCLFGAGLLAPFVTGLFM